MTTIAMSIPTAPIAGTTAPYGGSPGSDHVVEINLLLPERWAHDLMELSRQRQQSVGQIIRSMIEQGLHENSTRA
jgi:hypothetical protein